MSELVITLLKEVCQLCMEFKYSLELYVTVKLDTRFIVFNWIDFPSLVILRFDILDFLYEFDLKWICCFCYDYVGLINLGKSARNE